MAPTLIREAGLLQAFGLVMSLSASAEAQHGVTTHERCDLGGTYDVIKSGSAKVLGAATIQCDRTAGVCIASNGDREAQLEPQPLNIHRWRVFGRKGGGSWPRRLIATEGRDCTQLLFSNGTLWRRR